jgi:phosphoribosylaminoimidazolecarboxamide formyltransferase/IMP cyclohydrolase
MRALLSVFDKSGLTPFAQGLVDLGWELVSSGGTSKALAEAGIAHAEVDAVTGAPEMLGGRVKTLHPAIHGGILADRSKPEHMASIAERDIAPIDLVVCNLYPFVAKPSIEMIDVGGPTMVRAAAKNHAAVGIVVNPEDYDVVLAELRSAGSLTDATRRRLARDAFAHTADYDAAILEWFDAGDSDSAAAEGGLPQTLTITLEKAADLRYGENPHQLGARYREAGRAGWWDTMVQHSGIALSYLNLFDADAAWRLVHEMGDEPAAAIIKHANPCGAALAESISDAYRKAFDCDPVSAFGGIIALNRPVSAELAQEMTANPKADVIIAPGYAPEALELFATKKKNLRVLEGRAPGEKALELRRIDGGFLVQPSDIVGMDRSSWKVVTKAQPTEAQWRDVEVAWKVCAAVSSNAIVLVNDGQAVGIGAGQQSRLDSAAIAVRKAGDRAKGGVCASDAFFPFRDGLDAAAEAGVSVVVQPGGSMRDDEVIAAADEHGIAMVMTGERHFRH